MKETPKRKPRRTNNTDSVPVRVDKKTLDSIEPFKARYGSWNKAISFFVEKFMGEDKVAWALPSDIFNTKSQAMGESLKRAVQNGMNPKEKESPIRIAQVDDVI